MPNYKVLHTHVGPFPQGRVITSDDLKNIDVERLLRKKAIEETDDDPTPTALQAGPLTVGNPPPQDRQGVNPPDGGRPANRPDSGAFGVEDGDPDAEPEGEGEAPAKALNKMTKDELLAVAREKEIDGAEAMTKAELLAAIESQD